MEAVALLSVAPAVVVTASMLPERERFAVSVIVLSVAAVEVPVSTVLLLRAAVVVELVIEAFALLIFVVAAVVVAMFFLARVAVPVDVDFIVGFMGSLTLGDVSSTAFTEELKPVEIVCVEPTVLGGLVGLCGNEALDELPTVVRLVELVNL